VNVQRADDHRSHGVAGNSEREHGDAGPTDGRIVRRLRGDDPLISALAERPRRLLHTPSRVAIGKERCDVAPGSGQGPHADSDERALDDEIQVLEKQTP